jgi:uncharacterized protein
VKCFYHNDLDGHCAGAIVYRATQEDENDQYADQFIEINYNQTFPFEKIGTNERVFIVDFSLQKEGDFEKLLKITPNVIWIDHHKTAIERHKHIDDIVKGIRRDGTAGCVLTWEYFYPTSPTPQIVLMIGDYDIWNFTRWGNDLNMIQTAVRLYDNSPESEYWEEWIEDDHSLINLLEDGAIALQFRKNQYASLIKSWSFAAVFEGYKAICCNAGSVSSQLFDSVFGSYDLMIPFVFDGKQWTVSLYTKSESIDCSELAKKYGGGGHKKASGFQCKKLPF